MASRCAFMAPTIMSGSVAAAGAEAAGLGRTDQAEPDLGVRVAAARIGNEVRLPSLEIGCEKSGMSGDCDSGYSCAYTNNLAWRSETQPLPPILDPRSLFEHLTAHGIVTDWREPDVIRVAPTPLYNRQLDCLRFAHEVAAWAGIDAR